MCSNRLHTFNKWWIEIRFKLMWTSTSIETEFLEFLSIRWQKNATEWNCNAIDADLTLDRMSFVSLSAPSWPSPLLAPFFMEVFSYLSFVFDCWYCVDSPLGHWPLSNRFKKIKWRDFKTLKVQFGLDLIDFMRSRAFKNGANSAVWIVELISAEKKIAASC